MRIEAMPARRVVGTVHAVAIALPGSAFRQRDVPDLIGALGHRDASSPRPPRRTGTAPPPWHARRRARSSRLDPSQVAPSGEGRPGRVLTPPTAPRASTRRATDSALRDRRSPTGPRSARADGRAAPRRAGWAMARDWPTRVRPRPVSERPRHDKPASRRSASRRRESHPIREPGHDLPLPDVQQVAGPLPAHSRAPDGPARSSRAASAPWWRHPEGREWPRGPRLRRSPGRGGTPRAAPRGPSSARSGPKSQKNRNGSGASHSSPMKRSGGDGASSISAVTARTAARGPSAGSRSPKARLPT